jgi:hypothetical protein
VLLWMVLFLAAWPPVTCSLPLIIVLGSAHTIVDRYITKVERKMSDASSSRTCRFTGICHCRLQRCLHSSITSECTSSSSSCYQADVQQPRSIGINLAFKSNKYSSYKPVLHTCCTNEQLRCSLASSAVPTCASTSTKIMAGGVKPHEHEVSASSHSHPP